MTTAAAASTESQSPSGLARGVLIACLMAGTLMQVLDATIATVALPYIQGSMSASRDQITWILTSYVIGAAITTAPVGWVAGRFGRKNVYIICLIAFTISSAMCGASTSLEEIIVFRVIQGIMGAAMVPLSQSMMYDLYPPDRRGDAMALFGAGVVIGPILGPTLGGFLTDALNWRWVFYVNVPVGLAAALGIFLFPAKGMRNTTSPFDWTGFAFLGLGLGSLQLMLDRGTDRGWFGSPEIVIEALIAGLGIFMFAVHQWTAEKPLIPRSLLSDRNFIAGFIGFFIFGGTMFAIMAAMPNYLQTLGGYSVLQTGYVMSPRGVGTMIAMQMTARLAGRVDLRLCIFTGILLVVGTMVIMAGWTPAVSLTTLCVVALFQGFGTGLLFMPMNLTAFTTLSVKDRTDGAVMMALARNLGGGVGVSLASASLTSNMQAVHADLVQRLTPFNRPLTFDAPGMFYNPSVPAGLTALNETVQHQTMLIAYSNSFLFLAAFSAVTLIVLVVMKKPPRVSPADAPPPID